jgi:hypothetical protein
MKMSFFIMNPPLKIFQFKLSQAAIHILIPKLLPSAFNLLAFEARAEMIWLNSAGLSCQISSVLLHLPSPLPFNSCPIVNRVRLNSLSGSN